MAFPNYESKDVLFCCECSCLRFSLKRKICQPITAGVPLESCHAALLGAVGGLYAFSYFGDFHLVETDV